MALKAGIVGLPNVGKSTLFNALTSAKALAANYPFATKDPNIGVITVPDARLDKLYELVTPKSLVPTSIEIVDIAGLIKGASKGEGLGNQFLANIRETDAIIQVVRCFHDDNIVHVDGNVDPVRDKEVIDTELILKDIETVEKRLDRLRKSAKTGIKQEVHFVTVGEAIMEHLNSGKPARSMRLEGDDLELLEDMMLMTAKPILYVCNVDEASVHSGNDFTKRFMEAVKDEPAEVIFVSANIEAEIAQMDTKEERNDYLEMMGLEEPGVNRLIRATYKLLDLITYFTVGEKEVRAWTIHRGWKAPKAASVIHTDFEKGFIRAEVIKYEDYVKYGSEAAIKEAGKMGVEGKEYVVADGDCMHFRFNV
jgi:ribosome-binding ATPase